MFLGQDQALEANIGYELLAHNGEEGVIFFLILEALGKDFPLGPLTDGGGEAPCLVINPLSREEKQSVQVFLHATSLVL
jgi:hypothetical protein